MAWWRKKEARNEPENYTDAVIARLLEARSNDVEALPPQTTACELAASVVGRCFAVAEVKGDASGLLEPSILVHAAREMIRMGQSIFILDGGELLVAYNTTVKGNHMRSSWMYSTDLTGPSGSRLHKEFPSRVVAHCRYSYHSDRPWIGVSPFDSSRLGPVLLARLEQSMGKEQKSPIGSVMTMPGDGKEGRYTQLRNDLAKLGGDMALVETTFGGMGEGRVAAPRSDWMPSRIGPSVPDSQIALYEAVSRLMCAACGIPPALTGDSASSQSNREAYRQLLHSTIHPLAKIIEGEFSRVLGSAVKLDFTALMASDLQARARSFQSLVAGGMDIAKAAALSGMMQGED